MEYLDYFKRFPDAYDKVVASFDRARTLHEFLLQSAILDHARSVLSIGSGDGEVEVRLAKERGLRLGVVEPASLLFERFKVNAAHAAIEDQVVEALKQSFEDYTSTLRYDVVLALYSWFAFAFSRPLLEKAISRLNPNGKLLICLQAENSPSTRISAASRSSGINLTSEALSQFYKREGFDHQYLVYPGEVPASRYLNDDQLNQTGQDLVSFLNATPWEELPEDRRRAGFAALSQSAKDGKIAFASGCLVFTAPPRTNGGP